MKQLKEYLSESRDEVIMRRFNGKNVNKDEFKKMFYDDIETFSEQHPKIKELYFRCHPDQYPDNSIIDIEHIKMHPNIDFSKSFYAGGLDTFDKLSRRYNITGWIIRPGRSDKYEYPYVWEYTFDKKSEDEIKKINNRRAQLLRQEYSGGGNGRWTGD